MDYIIFSLIIAPAPPNHSPLAWSMKRMSASNKQGFKMTKSEPNINKKCFPFPM